MAARGLPARDRQAKKGRKIVSAPDNKDVLASRYILAAVLHERRTKLADQLDDIDDQLDQLLTPSREEWFIIDNIAKPLASDASTTDT